MHLDAGDLTRPPAGARPRLGAGVLDANLHGTSVLVHTVRTLSAAIDCCVVCVPLGAERAARTLVGASAEVVASGGDRGVAVLDVLERMPSHITGVLVHDAQRSLVCPPVLQRVMSSVENGAWAALPVLDVADTVKRVDAQGAVVATVDRRTLRRAQTPQTFDRQTVTAVLEHARKDGDPVPDVAAAVAAAGIPVTFVAGDERLLRLRSDADLAIAEGLMSTAGSHAR